MTRPRSMTWREAVERAVSVLEAGQCPPRHEAEPIINILRQLALTFTLGDVHVRKIAKQQSQECVDA